MSIFGIGIWEIVMIMLIALIVAGPRRLLNWAYVTGRFFAQMRQLWDRTVSAMQKEIDSAGVDFKLPKDPTDRRAMRRLAEDAVRPLREPMEKAMRDYEAERNGIQKELSAGDDRKVDQAGGQLPPAPPPRPSDFGTWSQNSRDD
ncbi:MAG: hypothetical protein EA396_02150 [Anaerolineaceae bacterium]|nr:MAG: hypothetical protein EA396_02150 [Anaerolineaceae bacterium]